MEKFKIKVWGKNKKNGKGRKEKGENYIINRVTRFGNAPLLLEP